MKERHDKMQRYLKTEYHKRERMTSRNGKKQEELRGVEGKGVVFYKG